MISLGPTSARLSLQHGPSRAVPSIRGAQVPVPILSQNVPCGFGGLAHLSVVVAARGRGSFDIAQMRRGVDDSGVRESLWEIAEHPFRHRVVFLGEQAQIVPEREQPLEQCDRVVTPADQREAVGEPEAAGEKDALAGRQPVGTRAAWVTANKAVLNQLALDRLDRAADPRVLARQKAELRDQQQRGVEIAPSVIPDEGVARGVVGAIEDLRVYFVAYGLPMRAGSLEPVLLDRFDGAVEGNPAHDL